MIFMKKILLLLVISSINISCNSQTDLETLKFEDKLLNLDNLEKEQGTEYYIKGLK